MSDSLTSISKKSGMPPGSLVHVGDVFDEESRICVIDYSKESVEKRIVQSLDEVAQESRQDATTWLNIEGLKNIDHIESIGQRFNIHPLVLEDILNTHQRPKFEEHDDYLFIVLKGLRVLDGDFSVSYEQISILVLDRYVITFKEKKDTLFDPVIKRLDNNSGRLRSLGSDYLAYTILDTIVDVNFTLLDSLDELVDSLEDELLGRPTVETLAAIQRAKRELVYIRRFISPLRELLAAILRSESHLIYEKTHIYFNDVYDHTIRITEAVESYRDMLTGLLDIYVSSVSNRMNEIMKVLTIFASIFIPLTFIAGVYGMNFEYMPELKWRWAYPVLWIFFIVIPLFTLAYFRRKKWL